jgi:organic hydroperoxide reductase OsmC/OhrA
MKEFPHCYSADAAAVVDADDVILTSSGIPALGSAAPAQFGGPGDRWSPETLIVAAIADCFILTFRAVARASTLPWTALRCRVTGTLDRIERVTQFTAFDLRAELCVPEGTDAELARRAMEKAERGCLVANSLKAPVHLHAQVVTGQECPAESLPASAA